jgi:hypothetical protein
MAAARPQCSYSRVRVTCTRSSARCESWHSRYATRSKVGNRAATKSVKSSSRRVIFSPAARFQKMPHDHSMRPASQNVAPHTRAAPNLGNHNHDLGPGLTVIGELRSNMSPDRIAGGLADRCAGRARTRRSANHLTASRQATLPKSRTSSKMALSLISICRKLGSVEDAHDLI